MRYFPLFADLQGRRVLVVGGGAVAARKVRLLLQAGAHVLVVAPQVRFPASMDREEGSRGQLAIQPEVFDPGHFEGVVFAIAATGDRVVNAHVAAIGRERNVLVNVVDDMELSSFIVPAIVDRSPLVVAISTGGVAPVLARLVRERLESMLDGSLGTLAGLLERWRSRIKSRLPGIDARRRFYEGVVRGRVAALLRSLQPGPAEL